MPICIKIGSFGFEVQRSQVGNRQTNERTNGQTNGRRDRSRIAFGQCTLTYVQVQYMFAVVIAFVCFYHAERILSAIAKFLVYLFGGWEGGNGRG